MTFWKIVCYVAKAVVCKIKGHDAAYDEHGLFCERCKIILKTFEEVIKNGIN